MLISQHLDNTVELALERSRGSPTTFGQSLNELMEEQQRDIPFLNVPILIRQACHHIVSEGSTAFGLFERAKDEDKVMEMIDAFEVDGKVRLGFIEVLDVAVLLMRFLGELPGSLLSEGGDVVRGALGDVDALSGLIGGLPLYERYTLKELFYMFSVVGRKKYASLDVNSVAQLIVGSYLSADLSVTEMVELSTELMLNYEVIFNFNDTAPNGKTPRSVFLESGKSVMVGSVSSVQDLREIVIAKARDIPDAELCSLYTVSGRSARKLDDAVDHHSIFFIPEIEFVPLEYPVVQEDFPMNLPPIEMPSDLPPIEMPTDLPPVDAPSNLSADIQFKKEEDKDPFLIWVFLNETSFRAKDWNPMASEEAEMFVDTRDGEGVCTIFLEKDPESPIVCKGSDLHQVFDSSRYFVFREPNSASFKGIGFYNREESSSFRLELMSAMYEFTV